MTASFTGDLKLSFAIYKFSSWFNPQNGDSVTKCFTLFKYAGMGLVLRVCTLEATLTLEGNATKSGFLSKVQNL